MNASIFSLEGWRKKDKEIKLLSLQEYTKIRPSDLGPEGREFKSLCPDQSLPSFQRIADLLKVPTILLICCEFKKKPEQ